MSLGAQSEKSIGKIVKSYCRRCDRALTHPDSIKRGYGKICFDKINGSPKIYHNPKSAKKPNSRPQGQRGLEDFVDPIEEEMRKLREKELPIKDGVFSEV